MSRRFLVIGYCGRGNVGDDALAVSLIRHLHDADNNSQFYLLAPRTILLDKYSKVNLSLVRQHPRDLLWKSIQSTDVVLAGGTHFHDFGGRLRWARVLTKYLILFAWCRLLRKRVTFLNIGVGSFRTWWGKLLGRMICGLADDISVREKSSFKVLVDMGLSDKTKLAFDASAVFVRDATHPVSRTSPGFALGISILPFGRIYHNDPQRDYQMADAFARAVNYLSSIRPDLEVSILAFNNQDLEGDVNISQYLFNQLEVVGGARVIEYENNPVSFLREVQNCQFFLSMRLHAIYFAYLSGIPQLMVPYHPKCSNVAQEIQMPPEAIVTEGQAGTGELNSRLEDLLMHPHRFHARLPVETARKRSLEPLDSLTVSRTSR